MDGVASVPSGVWAAAGVDVEGRVVGHLLDLLFEGAEAPLPLHLDLEAWKDWRTRVNELPSVAVIAVVFRAAFPETIPLPILEGFFAELEEGLASNATVYPEHLEAALERLYEASGVPRVLHPSQAAELNSKLQACGQGSPLHSLMTKRVRAALHEGVTSASGLPDDAPIMGVSVAPPLQLVGERVRELALKIRTFLASHAFVYHNAYSLHESG